MIALTYQELLMVVGVVALVLVAIVTVKRL